jgi:putative transposase
VDSGHEELLRRPRAAHKFERRVAVECWYGFVAAAFLLMIVSGWVHRHLHSKRYLIIDRDTKYSEQFRRLIRDNGTKVIRLPPMSPNLNAYAERFVRSIKEECLNRMIFIGQASLRRAVAEYMGHYHGERNHQGLQNRLIHVRAAVPANDGAIYRYARFGGTLSFYYCKAA